MSTDMNSSVSSSVFDPDVMAYLNADEDSDSDSVGDSDSSVDLGAEDFADFESRLNEMRMEEKQQKEQKQQREDCDKKLERDQKQMDKEAATAEREALDSATAAPKKRPNRVRPFAPGLNLFEPEQFLSVFKQTDLSLEKDFGYSRRTRLLQLDDFTSESLDELFSDPFLFRAYLAPSSCSTLIASEDDFVRICDYLFFFASSCLEFELRELYASALFELLTNYSYDWKLRIGHVWTVLKNLGMRSKCLECEEHLGVIMKPRIKLIRKKNKSFEYTRPKYFPFFETRKEQPAGEPSPVKCQEGEEEEDQQKLLVKWFLGFISDLLSTHLSSSEFKVRTHNWLPQLHLSYICGLLATDVRLLHDAIAWNHISLLFHNMFSSFSNEDWFGTKQGINSAEDDFSEVIAQVIEEYQGGNKDIFTWTSDALPILEHFQNMGLDHHHNLVHRLGALPPTYRGNRVRKSVAYQHLQKLMNPKRFVACDTNNSAASALDLITSTEYQRNRLFYNLFADRYVMLSALRLVDCMVGGDTSDHKLEKAEHILGIKTQFDRFKSNPTMKSSPDSDELLEINLVAEVMAQITTKWEVLGQRHKNIVGDEED